MKKERRDTDIDMEYVAGIFYDVLVSILIYDMMEYDNDVML
jgi:hypothetical protein